MEKISNKFYFIGDYTVRLYIVPNWKLIAAQKKNKVEIDESQKLTKREPTVIQRKYSSPDSGNLS